MRSEDCARNQTDTCLPASSEPVAVLALVFPVFQASDMYKMYFPKNSCIHLEGQKQTLIFLFWVPFDETCPAL